MVLQHQASFRFPWQRGLTRWVMVVGLLIALGGCALVRGEIGKPFPDDRIAEIEKGTSTRQDVADRLGVPDEIVEANGYEIFHYRRFDSKFG